MTKITKLSDYSGEDNFTSVFLKVNEIIDVVNSLALSDKEEECPACGKHRGHTEKDGTYFCYECPYPEPKQEGSNYINFETFTCGHAVPLGSKECNLCSIIEKPKQSTSLKEAVKNILNNNLVGTGKEIGFSSTEVKTDQIISLLQSYLVRDKEVEEKLLYNVGLLRQWLNERTNTGLLTNEDLLMWLK